MGETIDDITRASHRNRGEGRVINNQAGTLAQQPGKVYRTGVLSTGGPEQENFVWADLRRWLRERGWVEGQNLVIEWRYADAKYERLPDLAAEPGREGMSRRCPTIKTQKSSESNCSS